MNASVLLKDRAISGLPWQHRADVHWPTLWDTFLSVLTLFIHRFKPSIHRCNPPSHHHSTALFPLSHSYKSVISQPWLRYPISITPLSHSYKSVIPQPWLRYPTSVTPLSHIPNSIFLAVSSPSWLIIFKDNLLITNLLKIGYCNTSAWIRTYIIHGYTCMYIMNIHGKVRSISKTHPTKVQNSYNYTI